MVWLTNQQIGTWKRKRILVGSLLICWLILMFFTPKVPLHSFRHHVFADKRNFMGTHSLSLVSISLYVHVCNKDKCFVLVNEQECQIH